MDLMEKFINFRITDNSTILITSNMKYLIPIAVFLLIACQPGPQLEEGRWSGTLTPMNHPEMMNPMGYEVSYEGDLLSIQIVGPDSSLIPTRNPRIENDSLYFQFDEPEEQVTLDCILARDKDPGEGFAGRCTDESGKWARFTMVPPE